MVGRRVRGRSTTEIAARTAKLGFPMKRTAVRRSEKGSPRRNITLDEALGSSRASELPLEELVTRSGGR